jgi:hypothetical protein
LNKSMMTKSITNIICLINYEAPILKKWRRIVFDIYSIPILFRYIPILVSEKYRLNFYF